MLVLFIKTLNQFKAIGVWFPNIFRTLLTHSIIHHLTKASSYNTNRRPVRENDMLLVRLLPIKPTLAVLDTQPKRIPPLISRDIPKVAYITSYL